MKLAAQVPALLLAGLLYAQESEHALARVDGQVITERELQTALAPRLAQLRQQEYETRRAALEQVIEQKVLNARASARGLTPEQLLAQDVDAKIPEPTDGELEAYYLGQKDRLRRPFNDVKAELRQALKQARIQQARQAYMATLREKAHVAILLAPPKADVAYDSQRVRGKAEAPITVVEFSDFQCPYCQRAESTFKDVLAKYGDRLKVAYRDFPLRSLHANAEAAAEAARCAGDQGKFWQYHDLLFANQSKLDTPALRAHAHTLGLDDKQFGACLESGKYKDAVEKDVQDGTRAGVSGTPAFFINGIFLSGAHPAADFEKVIDEELARQAAAAAHGGAP